MKNYRRVAKRTRQEAFEVMNERYKMSEKYERQQQKMAKKESIKEGNGDIMEE
jgi:hypothetical protein